MNINFDLNLAFMPNNRELANYIGNKLSIVDNSILSIDFEKDINDNEKEFMVYTQEPSNPYIVIAKIVNQSINPNICTINVTSKIQ